MKKYLRLWVSEYAQGFGMSFFTAGVLMIVLGLMPTGENAWVSVQVHKVLPYYILAGSLISVGLVCLGLEAKEEVEHAPHRAVDQDV